MLRYKQIMHKLIQKNPVLGYQFCFARHCCGALLISSNAVDLYQNTVLEDKMLSCL